ncbi:MAG: single-stranded-DNA-specific exonuclease [Chloroflexi bacterium]|nr:MAG: single-stranded-DNA-specific exonuclease [Chloroflexota bacterium]
MPRERIDSYRGRRWIIPEPHELEPIPGTPYPPWLTAMLRRRGAQDAAQARAFLFDDPPPPPDPTRLPGIDTALDRIEQAVNAGEVIAVFGDFDVDGVTSTAILTEALRSVGANVEPYIPDRFQEGYGLSREALSWLRQDRNATLVITADLGITAVPEVEFASELGQDVIIIDHHSVPQETPDAYATINPKLPDSIYAFDELSTGGLAYRIAPLIVQRFGRTVDPSHWLDLATLSTVADVVPLESENRTLVRDGLIAIRETTRPGLRALLDVAGLADGELDTDSIAFALAPRINAAGRLAHARQAFDLLTETDPDRARAGAQELDRLNLQRRQMTTDAMQRATEVLNAQDGSDLAPLTFVQDPEIPSGIVGLVAGRLAEERHRPAIVCEAGPETARASCRSIAEFDIAQALRDRGELFVRHGGHAMAAGFTARTSDLGEIQDSLTALAGERLADVALFPRIEVDGQIPLERMAGPQVAWLQRLGPFGAGNPAPMFVSTGLAVVDARRVGVDKDHLKLRLRAGDRVWNAIAFRQGKAPVQTGDRVDAVWTLKRNSLYDSLELEIQDLAPADAAASHTASAVPSRVPA